MECSGGVELLPLCSIPAQMSRDGWAGATAKIYIPFYGYYLFSGATLNLSAGTIPQSTARFVGGNNIPGVFSKYKCECPSDCG